MAKGYRFNPPPNWPTPPQGWEPDRDWRKPPEWPEPPDGWQVWVPRKSPNGWILGVFGGLVAVIVLISMIGSVAGGGDSEPVAASTPSKTTSTDKGDPCITASDYDECAGSTPPATSEPSSDEPTTHAPDPKPKPHKHVTVRKFRKIAKDPDSYIGKRVVIFAEVTQFDSATGPDTFRGNAGAEKKRPEYGFVDFTQNTIFTGTERQLGDVVQGDLVKVRATCLGSLDYDTQIGGQTTVPMFQVDKVKRYGSVDS
ncbi:MAG: hypothetical protein ACRDQA_09340 [Nocardioidaceae bacterium]